MPSKSILTRTRAGKKIKGTNSINSKTDKTMVSAARLRNSRLLKLCKLMDSFSFESSHVFVVYFKVTLIVGFDSVDAIYHFCKFYETLIVCTLTIYMVTLPEHVLCGSLLPLLWHQPQLLITCCYVLPFTSCGR